MTAIVIATNVRVPLLNTNHEFHETIFMSHASVVGLPLLASRFHRKALRPWLHFIVKTVNFSSNGVGVENGSKKGEVVVIPLYFSNLQTQIAHAW